MLSRIDRRVTYFGLIVLVIVLIKTTAMQYLITVLIGPGAGRDVQQALDSSVSGLFLALLVGIYLEVVRERSHEHRLVEISNDLTEQVERLQSRAREDFLTSSQPDRLVHAALARVYDDADKDLDGLVDAILGSHRSIYRAVEVDYELEDPPSGDPALAQLTIRSRMTLRGVNELLIAFVVDESLIAPIYGTCQFLHDFWWVRTTPSLQSAVRGMERGDVMRIIQSPADGGVRPLRFTQVPRTDYHVYGTAIASSLLEASTDKFALMKATLPNEGQTTILTVVRSDVSLSVGRCYWMTDRPTQLNRLNFDWSRLRAGRDMSFSLVPFFTVRDIPATPVPGVQRIGLDINQWVLGGEGAVLFWSRPEQSQMQADSSISPVATP
jgi:hypothetical protein